MSQPSAERPIFWIFAGPNGSGKSSLYEDANIQDFGRSVWIINPDRLTLRVQAVEGLSHHDANLAAVQRMEAWVEASIRAHQTVGVETVLSTDKYRRLVSEAKKLGFEIRLIYIMLDTAERSVERVRLRVKKGGHTVPEDKIVDRRRRSLEQLPWFLDQADRAWLFDNSKASPREMGRKADGVIILDPDALPEMVSAVRSIESN